MSLVSKIDGLASGPQGSEQVFEQRKRFIQMFTTVAVAKGDALCIDPGTSTNGLGNHVKLADIAAKDTSHVIGVAGEDGAIGDLISVQVGGVCDYADLDDLSDDPGDLLGAGATAGRFTIMDASKADALPAAILLAEGSAGSGNSTVYLLNPLNL